MQRSAPLGQNRTHQNRVWTLQRSSAAVPTSEQSSAVNGGRLHVHSAHAAATRQPDIRLLHSSRTPLCVFFKLIFPPHLHSFPSNPPLFFSSSAHSFCPSFCPLKAAIVQLSLSQVSKSPRQQTLKSPELLRLKNMLMCMTWRLRSMASTLQQMV